MALPKGPKKQTVVSLRFKVKITKFVVRRPYTNKKLQDVLQEHKDASLKIVILN